MKIKYLYQRFRYWQQDPFHYEESQEGHTCANCGHDYVGEYCPVCGQNHSVGRISWKSVGQEFMRAWGIESRSLISSIIQLLGRPGYLISDYLNGRRQVCNTPVSLLFVVAMIVMLILHITGLDATERILTSDIENEYVKQGLVWLWSNLGWCMLFETILLILPTWLLFRFSPKHSYHTIPEGIYIQLFMGSLVLIFSMASEVFRPLSWVIPIYYYFAYRQLFGYGTWGTIWRTLLVLCEGILVPFIIILMIVVFFMGELSGDKESLMAFLLIIAAVLIINAVILFIGYRIGKRSFAKQSLNAEV